MEAPERININPDMTFVEIDDPLVEYVRADLCTMPGELVELARKRRRYWATEMNSVDFEFYDKFLAWHEGKNT